MGVVSRKLKDEKAIDVLPEYGFVDQALKSMYEVRRLAGNGTVVLYSSGKLVIQGKDNIVTEVEKIIFGKAGAKDEKRFDDSEIVRTGGDECLKGDTFGGLVVCCIKADRKLRRQLFSLGVTDSKKIADSKIMKMGAQILRVLGNENVSVVELYPAEYNQRYNKYGSVTRILNSMYMKAMSEIGGADECVVDQYPGCRVKGCKSVEKGESKYIEIAAASVIARYRGLLQIDSCSKRAGFDLPKGSTHVKWALIRLKRENKKFDEFVKIHFRNVAKFLG